MANRGAVFRSKLFVACVILLSSSVGALTIKPSRQNKIQTSTSPPGSRSLVTPAAASLPVTENSGVAYYRLKNLDGKTCTLLKTDGLVEVNFRLHGEDDRGDTYLPDEVTIDGNCRNEDTSSMSIAWKGYSLRLYFSKTPGGERWYIGNLELTVNTDDAAPFHNIMARGNKFTLTQREMLIPTPVGKSYSCEETVIPLTPDKDDELPSGLHLNGTLFFRAFQLQPFMYKSDDFGPPFHCNAVKGFRDETAPIAVGSTLAIAVLGTISGYGIYRYLKVKKVQYNTME